MPDRNHRNPPEPQIHRNPKAPKPKKRKKRENSQNQDFIKSWIYGLFWSFEASRLSKSSPGGQIMLVDKISAKMDGYGPLSSQNFKKAPKPKKDKKIKKEEYISKEFISSLHRKAPKYK